MAENCEVWPNELSVQSQNCSSATKQQGFEHRTWHFRWYSLFQLHSTYISNLWHSTYQLGTSVYSSSCRTKRSHKPLHRLALEFHNQYLHGSRRCLAGRYYKGDLYIKGANMHKSGSGSTGTGFCKEAPELRAAVWVKVAQPSQGMFQGDTETLTKTFLESNGNFTLLRAGARHSECHKFHLDYLSSIIWFGWWI